MPLPLHAGLSALADRYDGYILDLWGVVHDGRQPYPRTLDGLYRLRDAGKRVLLLSNAPRRSTQVAAFLERIGVPAAAYDAVITSGELTRRAMEDADQGGGEPYFYLGPERDAGLLDGLSYRRVAALDDAAFLLCTGLYDDEHDTVADYDGLLAAAAARGVLLICVNPDLTVMRGDRVLPCAGGLALAYQQRGGPVRYHGKPHADAYQASLAWLGCDPRRVLAVGDSLRTDIVGANAHGLDCLLVISGIHAEEWGVVPGVPPDLDRIEQACRAAGAVPTGVLAEFGW